MGISVADDRGVKRAHVPKGAKALLLLLVRCSPPLWPLFIRYGESVYFVRLYCAKKKENEIIIMLYNDNNTAARQIMAVLLHVATGGANEFHDVLHDGFECFRTATTATTAAT
jgi:hypothetical protein